MVKQLRFVVMVALVMSVAIARAAHGQASLGFTIDPMQGLPGGTVAGQVNPADVAAHCVTDLTAFETRFADLLAGPFVSGNTEGDLPQRFFPDPNNIVYENDAQLSYVLTLAVVLGIANNISGAAETALPQTFVMTFADIATQVPVGELGHFDPVTGQGSVVVPDVTPGPWAVAAACVGPVFDLDTLEAGIRQGGEYLASIGAQFGPDGPFSPEFIAFMQSFLNTDLEGFDLLIAFVSAIGQHLLQPIVTPDALGVAIFNVLAPDTPTPTPTPTATPTPTPAAPTSKDDCRNDGWKNFTSPPFKNQGDCIQFVNTGK